MPWDCACGATGLTTAYCGWCGRWAPVTSFGPPPWTPPPTSRRGGIGTVVAGGIAATVAALVAIGGIGAALDGSVAPTERTTHPQARQVTHGARHTPAFDAAITSLKAYVAKAHGAPFTKPVRVEALSEKAFTDVVLGDGGDGRDPFSDTLAGLGLAGDQDAEQTRDDVLSSDIVGLYDHENDILYVRGLSLSPYAKLVLVHELTHAWQDQHYDLEAMYDRAENTDAVRAVRALIEGDAVRIEDQWRAAQPAAARTAIAKVEMADDADTRKETVGEAAQRTLLSFSYGAGVRFVRDVAAHGGNKAVDAAFRDPPVSTEQVMYPDAFRAGVVPEKVSEPAVPDDAKAELDDDVLGELGLVVFATRGQVTHASLVAVRGWRGDHYATYRGADNVVCTEVDVAMENRATRDRLLRFLAHRGLGTGGHATATSDSKLAIVSCER